MGIFPQAGSYLVPDYQSLIEQENFQDITEFFESRSIDEDKPKLALHAHDQNFLQKVKEEQAFTPFKMDAFQENALKAIKRGNSIVVHGPPGTGKSQLICNLISDFIARGKRVLLVCQKKAALDVVYKRLEEQDAKEFVALVHDFKNDRRNVYKQIAEQIERLYEYRLKNNSLDAIQLERKFIQASRRIDQITEELEELKFALFDREESGLSVKELYLTSDLNAPAVSLNQEYKFFKLDDLNDFLQKFRYYVLYSSRFMLPRYPWVNRKSFKDYTISDLQNIQKILKEIPKYKSQLLNSVSEVISVKVVFEECEELFNNTAKIKELNALMLDDGVYASFTFMVENAGKQMDQLWLANVERVLLDCFKGEGPEVSLATEDLGEFQEVLQEAIEAQSNFIKWFWWRTFSRKRYVFRRVLQANGLKLNKLGLAILIEKIDNRLNVEHNITKLKSVKWLKEIPGSYNKLDFQTWFSLQKKALIATLSFNSFRNFKNFFNLKVESNKEITSKLESVLDIVKEIPQKKEEWLIYLTPPQVALIIEDENHSEVLSQALKRDFEDLCSFDQLQENLKPHETQVINKVLDEIGRDKNVSSGEESKWSTAESDSSTSDGRKQIADDPENASGTAHLEQLFQNSLRLAWIAHIEIKYPVLRTVTSLKFRELEKELQECVKEKLQISKEILLLKARERTYHDVEFNRLNNMVTYRDILHQVTKKKRIWPIRKLIAEHHEELFNLVPCWMASPESVSAMFPMKQLFDLVIFDEASQCFAERGIPAMYRGRQIVVTGDDKQLSPNDLYQVRWEEEAEESAALEVDSLLELCKQYLMEIQLQEHYRSKSLSLIDFSNQHFYNNRLRLLPDHQDINNEEPAIEFIKVDGVWENNVNKIEAEAVIKLLKEITLKKPGRSVGIVTFNALQQNEISDLIDVGLSTYSSLFPADIFVKNIENIQGDEKDIIIFSTAYGPDPKGKLVMNFGTLNAAKGENRLNVAVTRAREKVYVISSLFPADLKVETSKNEGPKLLKKYLQYAKEVSEGKYKPKSNNSGAYDPSWFLKHKMASIMQERHPGFVVTDELPFADLTIKQDGKYRGLLITDDNLYHQAISVKDPHVYTPFILHHKKWKFMGVFSREFWNNKQQLEDQLMLFINKIESNGEEDEQA